MTGLTMRMDSPIGWLELVSNGDALTHVSFLDVAPEPEASGSGAGDPLADPLLLEARRQLDDYFHGRLRAFDLPLAAAGTDFQKRVWAQLCRIPFGTTASYADVAARLHMPPGASRAVGLANGANPIAIVVPCHRVIGSNGTLVGYAGGLHRKRFLLDLESPVVQDGLFGE